MAKSRPVLLVHGAWHGPWCWSEWSRAIEAEGHQPQAIALPGHELPGSTARIWNRLGDYIDEVRSALDSLGPATVVVGHSMGGLVVQRALEKRSAALAVLLASVPISGVLGATLRTARRIPATFAKVNATLSMYPIVASEHLTRTAFFGDAAGRDEVLSCFEQLQNESYLAYLQMFVVRPRPSRVSTPVKVIAAEGDTIFSIAEEHRLARAYGTDLVVIPDSGHDLMLDPAGRPALAALLRWLEDPEPGIKPAG